MWIAEGNIILNKTGIFLYKYKSGSRLSIFFISIWNKNIYAHCQKICQSFWFKTNKYHINNGFRFFVCNPL